VLSFLITNNFKIYIKLLVQIMLIGGYLLSIKTYSLLEPSDDQHFWITAFVSLRNVVEVRVNLIN